MSIEKTLLVTRIRTSKNVEVTIPNSMVLGSHSEPRPFVLQTALGDFAVANELNAYTDEAKHMARMYSELHQNIQDRCTEADIEILSPAYTSFRDGDARSLVPRKTSEGRPRRRADQARSARSRCSTVNRPPAVVRIPQVAGAPMPPAVPGLK